MSRALHIIACSAVGRLEYGKHVYDDYFLVRLGEASITSKAGSPSFGIKYSHTDHNGELLIKLA